MVSPKMFDLSGKVAVVTGGNGGIGRAIALGLAEAGASVAILARNQERNRDTLADWNGRVYLPWRSRSTFAAQVLKPALEEVEHELGPIDILVNNAGFAVLKGVLDHTEEDWDSVIDTDTHRLLPPVEVCGDVDDRAPGGQDNQRRKRRWVQGHTDLSFVRR